MKKQSFCLGLLFICLWGGADEISAPLNLELLRSGYSKVSFRWTRPVGTEKITGYEVYRDGELITTVSDTAFTDENLQSQTTYVYTVVAKSVGGLFSTESAPLRVGTMASVPFEKNNWVEYAVDNFPEPDVMQVSAELLVSSAQTAMEALFGLSAVFSTTDSDELMIYADKKLRTLRENCENLSPAERLQAESELQQVLTADFGGAAFDRIFIANELEQLAEAYWRRGNHSGAKMLYEMALVYWGQLDSPAQTVLSRLSVLELAALAKDASVLEKKAAVRRASQYLLRFDQYAGWADDKQKMNVLRQNLFQYFQSFPGTLPYENYDMAYFAEATRLAEKLGIYAAEHSLAQNTIDRIHAWELLQVDWRLTDKAGQPLNGALIVTNLSAREVDPFLFSTAPMPDERELRLQNGKVSFGLYRGHRYQLQLLVQVPGGNDLRIDLTEFAQKPGLDISYDENGNILQSGTGDATNMNAVVQVQLPRSPYNLKALTGIDVFDLDWDWAENPEFVVKRFHVYCGEQRIATTTDSFLKNIPLAGVAGVYTYKVLAEAEDGSFSEPSKTIRVIPGDQSGYSDFFQWLQGWFGDTPVLSTDDPDGDGLTNYEEFLKQSDPTRVPAALPYGTRQGYSKLTLNWTPVADAILWEISRNGDIVGSSEAETYTDEGLIAGIRYSYRVRCTMANGSSSDWSEPLVLETRVPERFEQAESLQHVVDLFHDMSSYDLDGLELFSGVRNAFEGLFGVSITFAAADEELIRNLIDRELEYIHQDPVDLSATERALLAVELDEYMQQSFGGESFEHIYMKDRIEALAEDFWAQYYRNPQNASGREHAWALLQFAMQLTPNDMAQIRNTCGRLGMMASTCAKLSSDIGQKKQYMEQARDFFLHILQYTDDPATRGIAYCQAIQNYYLLLPELFAYDHYDQELYDMLTQLGTAGYAEYPSGQLMRVRKTIAEWALSTLNIRVQSAWPGAVLQVNRVDDSFAAGQDTRTVALDQAQTELKIYRGKKYELKLIVPIAGAPDWVSVFPLEPMPAGTEILWANGKFSVAPQLSEAEQVGVTIDLNLPQMPYNLRSEVQVDTFDLEWAWADRDGFSCAYFEVFRGDEKVGESPVPFIKSLSRQLSETEYYWYRVRAVSADGQYSAWSIPLEVLPNLSDADRAYFEWKKFWFKDLPTLGTDDPDHDGLTNYQEYLLGSNPLLAPAEGIPELPEKQMGALVKYFHPLNAQRDMSALEPFLTRVQREFCFASTSGNVPGTVFADYVGMRVEGYFQVDATGVYNLYISSDDRCRWYIDGRLAAANEQQESTQEYLNQVRLSAGIHTFKVEYSELERTARLELFWSGPDMPRRRFDQSPLWYWEEIPADLKEYFLHQLDSDGDGLTDGEELLLETDRFNPDSDGDGLTDGEEVDEWLTDPNNPDSDGDGVGDSEMAAQNKDDVTGFQYLFVPAQKLLGADFSAKLGDWQPDGDGIVCLSRRGSIEYDFTVSEAGIMRIDFSVREFSMEGISSELDLYVDGIFVDRVRQPFADEQPTTVQCYMPYLAAGSHKLKIVRDNYRNFAPLYLNDLSTQFLRGGDAAATAQVNAKILAKRNRVAGEGGDEIVTYTSPYCLTGSSKYPEWTRVNGKTVQLFGAEDWFSEIALAEEATVTEVGVQFENNGHTQQAAIRWDACDLLRHNGETIQVRRGDQLKLTMKSANAHGPKGKGGESKGPEANRGGKNSKASHWQITTSHGVNLTGKKNENKTLRFTDCGEYELSGILYDDLGNETSASIQVQVIDYSFDRRDTACWLGWGRDWEVPAAMPGVNWCFDKRLLSVERAIVEGKQLFRTYIDDNKPRYIAARLGESGPILGVQTVSGIGIYSSNKTLVREAEVFEDGSKMYEMLLIMSEPREDIELHLNIFVSGVIFDDGTISKVVTAEDFDEYGMLMVNFIHAPEAQTSICHNLSAFQAGEYIGTRTR